jgi:hypothetical protein
VTRVMFSTARHDGSLGINQVRCTLYMVSLVDRVKGLYVSRKFSAVYAMRAKNSSYDQSIDSAAVGATPISFSY